MDKLVHLRVYRDTAICKCITYYRTDTLQVQARGPTGIRILQLGTSLDRHWWASDVKRLDRVTQMPEVSRRNPAVVDENNVSRLFRALEVGPKPTRAL